MLYISPNMKRYKLSLFIFRRDLRLDDNNGLIEAELCSERVLPCFVFDPRQVEHHEYRSLPALQFMVECLEGLSADITELGGKLCLLYAEAPAAVRKLIAKHKIDALFLNRDYTPFSVTRDDEIKKVCDEMGVDFHAVADALLHEPEQVLKKDGKPYTIFTPYFAACSKMSIRKPMRHEMSNLAAIAPQIQLEEVKQRLDLKPNPHILARGGRKEAEEILGRLAGLEHYQEERDFPALGGTSGLSANNKFGTVSIREVYHAIVTSLGETHPLIRQLYWRDFFCHIAFHFPHVFHGAFTRHFDNIEWCNEQSKFDAWCEGQTGFPIVDAGMRELNTTGFMHNRVRMITASFLSKDLHIDWRWGERYFAQKLVDYDPAVNNGNWQWAASTGCDAQPYFRIFNPWLQQAKFDPDAQYIRRWVPELADKPPSLIHRKPEAGEHLSGYPEPIIEHALEKEKTQKMYEWAKQTEPEH